MLYILHACPSLSELQNGKHFLSQMGSSSLFKSHALDSVQYFLFEQHMPEIKVLTSIFSFDYKHMAEALSLTPGWDTNYVFQAWTQLTLLSGNTF